MNALINAVGLYGDAPAHRRIVGDHTAEPAGAAFRPQVIGLRLYTGPMFELYNGVLRAWANTADPGIVPSFAAVGAGLDVCGRFTSTLHAVNSGVVKLSQLQPATVVYRGVSGMKLPEPFLVPSKFNVRGGVEYGFMSATLDQRVALRYATSNPDEPSTLMVMQVTHAGRSCRQSCHCKPTTRARGATSARVTLAAL